MQCISGPVCGGGRSGSTSITAVRPKEGDVLLRVGDDRLVGNATDEACETGNPAERDEEIEVLTLVDVGALPPGYGMGSTSSHTEAPCASSTRFQRLPHRLHRRHVDPAALYSFVAALPSASL